MGRKVNPVGFRLGFNKNWSAHWFGHGNRYSQYLEEDSRIRDIINKKHGRAGISEISISRNRGDIVVSISTSKPGILIGRSGSGSQDLKAQLERTLAIGKQAGEKQNVRLNIIELKTPETSAKLVAETIAGQIERRIAVKRAIRQAIERSMEKHVKGIKVRVSGRLGGAEIARSEVSSSGSIPLQTLRSNVDYAMAEAVTTYGVIGVKVWIYSGESANMPAETTTQSSHRPNKHR
jgi:small subunit ribosomal protein S3